MYLTLKEYFVEEIDYKFNYVNGIERETNYNTKINSKVYIAKEVKKILLIFDCKINNYFLNLNIKIKFVFEYKTPEGKDLEDYNYKSPLIFIGFPILRSFIATLTTNLNTVNPIILPVINIERYLMEYNNISIEYI